MKPAPFTYHRASSAREAVDMLASAPEDSSVLAGGRSRVPLGVRATELPATAQRIVSWIEAAGGQMELVDLSQEIYQGMPVYPGHLKTVIWTHATHEETARNFEGGFSFVSSGLLMSDHGPTHVDAIAHLDPRDGAPTIDAMPLDTFYGDATCVDVSHKAPHEYVSAAEMEAAEAAGGVRVEPGTILLVRTGTVERLGGTPEYTSQYCGLDESAAEWLRERRVKAFGVDSPSPDNPISRTYPVHMMCREAGITHFENLANLDRVVGRRFTFIGFPLRIRAGTGSPVRAVAVLP